MTERQGNENKEEGLSYDAEIEKMRKKYLKDISTLESQRATL